jgi:hypothetical protein
VVTTCGLVPVCSEPSSLIQVGPVSTKKGAAATGCGGGAEEVMHFVGVDSAQCTPLESVFKGKLDGAIVADCASDLPEVRVSHATVRSRVVSDVKGVEQIGAEVQAVLVPERKALENCHVDVLETRLPQRARPNSAKCIVRLLSEDAATVVLVGAAGILLHSGSIVSIDGAAGCVQRAKLVGPRRARACVDKAGIVCR